MATDPRQRNRQVGQVQPDRFLLWTLLALMALGIVMLASTSLATAEERTGSAFHFLQRQLLAQGLGLAGIWVVCRYFSLEVLCRLGPLLLFAVIVVLGLLLVPGFGHEVNGSVRWLALGPLNLQPSEAAKLAVIIYLAGFLQRHWDSVNATSWGSIRPLLPVAVVAALILLEPDLGAAAVLVATALGLVFLAGMRLLPLLLILVAGALSLALALVLSPYRYARLTSFQDPWDDPFGSDFQLIQSLIAIGRGETLGVGLGDGVQKLFYLPEAHTDFIFAVIAEELGLIGVVAVLALFALLVWRCFYIGVAAGRAKRVFQSFLSFGVGIWFALQALINIGVNLGLLPTKGLTLPLISYGGSSVLVMLVALGLVMRVDMDLRRGVRRLAPDRAPGPRRSMGSARKPTAATSTRRAA
jgi:cell division protein FtsW